MARRVEMDRAARAWQYVHDEISREKADVYKVYGARAQDLPALIHTDGLGQTLAFLRAKSKGKKEDPHYRLFTHLSLWVLKQVPSASGHTDDLLQALIASDSIYYRRATVETLAFAGWLKKFVEAVFGNEIEGVEVL